MSTRTSGCSTRGYDPSRELRGEGASERQIRAHMSAMPSFIREEGAHVGPGDIITFCRRGRLHSIIEHS